MGFSRALCALFLFTLMPLSGAVAATAHNGPDDLARDLRHHQIGRLTHFLGPRALINDKNGRLIAIAKRNDVVHAFHVAGVAHVINVGLACVDLRTYHRPHMPVIYDNGRAGNFRSSSYFAVFTFSQAGSIAGLIFATYKDATNIC